MSSLIVDCQILQTAAYDRGMGKYSLSLLRAMLEENKTKKAFDEMRLIFNKNLSTTERTKEIVAALGGLPYDELDLATAIDTDTAEKIRVSRRQLKRYFEASYVAEDAVSYLLMAPFFVGYAATFPDIEWVRKLTIVYDVIPYKIWHLQRIFPDDLYAQHFATLMEADHLFTISNAVRDDMSTLVGIPEDMMTNIDGAAFDMAKPKKVHRAQLKEPYVLMNSAPIIHKNNDRAVEAFEVFNKRHGDKYTLFITSNFDDATKERLSKLSVNVSFLGNIPDEELIDAYERAACLLFPSMAEGLGLPILEAVQSGIPIACSNIPVFSELSQDAFYRFNPLSVPNIADRLNDAVDKVGWSAHKAAYREVEDKYTWQRCAKLLMGELSEPLKKHKEALSRIALTIPSPRKDTPGGVLGELIYARLCCAYGGPSLQVCGSGDKRPSFAAYLQNDKKYPKAINVAINDTPNPVSRLFGISSVTVTAGETVILRCKARRRVVDNSLRVSTWQLYKNDKIITLDAVVGLIEKHLRT